VVIGLFALNYQGLQGSLLTMINLGFSTAGLFFIAGFLYSRQQNTQLAHSAAWPNRPNCSQAFSCSRWVIGLPAPMASSVNSSLLLGTFKANWLYGGIAVTGVIFGAAYFLWYYERSMLGPLGQGRQGLHP